MPYTFGPILLSSAIIVNDLLLALHNIFTATVDSGPNTKEHSLYKIQHIVINIQSEIRFL